MAYGGQCVAYANSYFGSSVRGNGSNWFTSSSVRQVPIQSGCVACWSGGKGGYGHVAVVESWDGSTMNYSDSNYNGDQTIIRRNGITVAQMKRLFGSSYTFQGFVVPK